MKLGLSITRINLQAYGAKAEILEVLIHADLYGLRHSVFDRTLTGDSGNNRNFRTHLSGDEEVPALDTRAQDQTIFQLSKDGSELSYKLIVANIENITQAHIHCGAAVVNGLVVIFLYPDVLPAVEIPGRFDNVLAEGVRTNAMLLHSRIFRDVQLELQGFAYLKPKPCRL